MGWRHGIQNSLLAIVTFTPLAVAIRYKWAEFILPLSVLPLTLLLAISSESRATIAEVFSAWRRSALGVLGATAALWLAMSPFWSPDPAFAATNAAKALGIIAAAFAVAAILRTISADRIFPWLVTCTIAATCIATFTALSGGLAHRAVGCCRNGMQADMTGSAVTIALFVWPCLGWLVANGRRLSALLVFGLACLLITVSKSGAAGLALLAGSVTVGIGTLVPRLIPVLTIILTAVVLVTAPLLSDLGHFLERSGLLGHLAAYHAAERIEIWSFYTELFWQRPWTGFGIDAERILGHPARAAEFTTLIPNRYADLHAHNAPLQVLFEFGIIGGALALATVTAAAGRLFAGPQSGLAFAMAPVVAFIAAAIVNFSIWETWWLAVVSLAFVFSHRLLHTVSHDATSDPLRPLTIS